MHPGLTSDQRRGEGGDCIILAGVVAVQRHQAEALGNLPGVVAGAGVVTEHQLHPRPSRKRAAQDIGASCGRRDLHRIVEHGPGPFVALFRSHRRATMEGHLAEVVGEHEVREPSPREHGRQFEALLRIWEELAEADSGGVGDPDGS